MQVVIHYGEIGTKGLNRSFFEQRLMDNIKTAIPGGRVKKQYGRIVLDIPKPSKDLSAQLKKIYGISYFSVATPAKLSFIDIKKKAVAIMKNISAKTFKVETKRSYKEFPMTSLEVSERVGEAVLKATKLWVDVHTPEVTLYIEITEKGAYLYTNKERGAGGLPIGVAGKVVCLLSGGIDSPVAACQMMKRGCRVIFVHFYPESAKEKQLQEKIKKLVSIVGTYQHGYKLYLIPFGPFQHEIIKQVPSEYRMIVYRRMMLRIAERIRRREGAKGFVTGDNLAQVASQTLDNLAVIYAASMVPVFHPLIGYDKQEIIDCAKKIGTYETSIIHSEDCCTFMVAEHPKTNARREYIETVEEKIPVEKLVTQAMAKKNIEKNST
ncbi:MAG: tRNA 4-thiouridine(8) synthase ThiI [Candidatus Aenigmarchaeota archaeon]|nr:tRNA 4-thiouridine(8) synthase ThiI [Candidatus Aenigmarchaeota archaeon]